MTILVMGSTGFTGSAVVRHLLEAGLRPRCLARPSSDVGELRALDAEIVYGDIADTESCCARWTASTFC
jgi:dihydroflavonol-4-reductase